MKKLFLVLFVISSLFIVNVIKADPVIVIKKSTNLENFIFAAPTNFPYSVDFTVEGVIKNSDDVGVKTSSGYVIDQTGWKKVHCLFEDKFLVTFLSLSSTLSDELNKFLNNESKSGTFKWVMKDEEEIYVGNSKTWLEGYYTFMSMNNTSHECSSQGGKITFTINRKYGTVKIHIKNVRPYFDKPEFLTMDPKKVKANFPTMYSNYDFNSQRTCKVYIPSFDGCGDAGLRIIAKIDNTPDKDYSTINGTFIHGKYKNCGFELKILKERPSHAYIELFRKEIPVREINSAILTIVMGRNQKITQKITGVFYLAQDLHKVDQNNYRRDQLLIEGTFSELNSESVSF
ncbi:MAG: hypothetical protein NTY12_02450 [Candidatus Falkowbacteria bacterium]|nr:hypothetical protein [Candidatus Falkowbacteria bacterium]